MKAEEAEEALELGMSRKERNWATLPPTHPGIHASDRGLDLSLPIHMDWRKETNQPRTAPPSPQLQTPQPAPEDTLVNGIEGH